MKHNCLSLLVYQFPKLSKLSSVWNFRVQVLRSVFLSVDLPRRPFFSAFKCKFLFQLFTTCACVCVCVEGYLDVRCSPSTSRDGNSRRDRKRVVSAFSDYSAICTDSIQVFRYHGLPVEFMWFLKRSYLIFVCEVCLSFLRLHSTVWLGLCSLITGEGEQTSPWKS